MELPVGLPHGGLAAAGLPLCGGDGSAAAAPSAVGRPSSLRGVASHNGSRYESHVWSAGRQVGAGLGQFGQWRAAACTRRANCLAHTAA